MKCLLNDLQHGMFPRVDPISEIFFKIGFFSSRCIWNPASVLPQGSIFTVTLFCSSSFILPVLIMGLSDGNIPYSCGVWNGMCVCGWTGMQCQSRIIVFVWNLSIFLDTRNLRVHPEFVLHMYIHTYANYLWYLVLLLETSSKRVGFYGEKMFNQRIPSQKFFTWFNPCIFKILLQLNLQQMQLLCSFNLINNQYCNLR